MADLEYKEMIEELVSEFKKTIPNEETKLVARFEEFLYNSIEAIENSDSKFIAKDKDSIERTIRRMADRLTNSSLELKRNELIGDENLMKISGFSHEVFNIAQKILQGEEVSVDTNYSEKIDEIKKMLELVQPYNQQQARELFSEAVLDIEFINNPNTDIVSLRLGRIKRALENNSATRTEKIDEGDER